MPEQQDKADAATITVTKNGPFIVTGGVPLIQEEICNDEEGYCRNWRVAKRFPAQQQYALCRCGHSKNKPFCDGTHEKIGFNGAESAGSEPYLTHPRVTCGPDLELHDYENLCAHARFCMRAGGIWDLVENPDNPSARETAIEEACNCPSGRLVLKDSKTGKVIEMILFSGMFSMTGDRDCVPQFPILMTLFSGRSAPYNSGN